MTIIFVKNGLRGNGIKIVCRQQILYQKKQLTDY